MAALALASQGPITAEARPRAGVVCIQLPSDGYLHANPEEAARLAQDIERALVELRMADTTAQQYANALTFTKAEAA
ncbi:hypothetical protein [Stenotrophomonas chelatiphaga]|uniref:hypothetical protein n=1 Tax=Stenotrophomonas chelatiphaga TaxID=517011 RepID=UPI00289CA399|nr:hypothetical protein [Stenotrophomonas chelatiphaga]